MSPRLLSASSHLMPRFRQGPPPPPLPPPAPQEIDEQIIKVRGRRNITELRILLDGRYKFDALEFLTERFPAKLIASYHQIPTFVGNVINRQVPKRMIPLRPLTRRNSDPLHERGALQATTRDLGRMSRDDQVRMGYDPPVSVLVDLLNEDNNNNAPARNRPVNQQQVPAPVNRLLMIDPVAQANQNQNTNDINAVMPGPSNLNQQEPIDFETAAAEEELHSSSVEAQIAFGRATSLETIDIPEEDEEVKEDAEIVAILSNDPNESPDVKATAAAMSRRKNAKRPMPMSKHPMITRSSSGRS